MPRLVVDDITKEFPTPAEPLVILQGASLDLKSGQNLAIVGPSGSGKSTLLHIVGTLDSPTSGQVLLDDENPFELSEPDLARFRNRHIGFVFQEHHLLPQLTVLENVLIPTVANGKPGSDVIERASDLVERVGLGNRMTHRPAELSGGERGRVAVARALIREPMLVLADEPTGNLDRKNAQGIAQLLLELQQQENTMLIVVTHSNDLAEMLQKKRELIDGKLEPC